MLSCLLARTCPKVEKMDQNLPAYEKTMEQLQVAVRDLYRCGFSDPPKRRRLFEKCEFLQAQLKREVCEITGQTKRPPQNLSLC